MRVSPGLLLGIVSHLVTHSLSSSSSLDFVVSGEELPITPKGASPPPPPRQGLENCQRAGPEPCWTMPGTRTKSGLLLRDIMDWITA